MSYDISAQDIGGMATPGSSNKKIFLEPVSAPWGQPVKIFKQKGIKKDSTDGAYVT
jgi:hypothetical protein